MPYHTNGNNNGTRENLYTGGGEYMCQTNNYPGCGNGPNGTYVGPMHYHPSKGYMVGATHSEQPHPLLMPVNGNNRMYNRGGKLTGPSHERGGIPARVGKTTPIELEGGEYIINKQTVDAVGEGFLSKLNSTATTHHTGGFKQGQLPSPSMYRNGGKVPNRRNKMRRGGKPVGRKPSVRRTKPTSGVRKMAGGGSLRREASSMRKPVNRNTRRRQSRGSISPMRGSYRTGGRVQKFAHGGSTHAAGFGQYSQNPCPSSESDPTYVNFVEVPQTNGTHDYYCCEDVFRSEKCRAFDQLANLSDIIYF